MASSDKSEKQQIDISKLSIQQLSQFKQQIENDINVYQESLQNLKIAQIKFNESKDSVDKLTPSCKGKSIMVPLTGSMYVPGTISDAENVLIDIGTGYYVQKDLESAREYFKRKLGFLTDQITKVQAIDMEKNRIREAVVNIMESKVQAQLGAQRQGVKA